MSYDLLRKPNQVISFQTKQSPYLPLKYTNVTTEGVVSYGIALSVEDISAKFQQMVTYYPELSTDPTKADFVIIRHNSGEREVLALQWVDEDTIQSTQRVNKRIDLYGVDSTINERLIKMLKLLNVTDFKITDV